MPVVGTTPKSICTAQIGWQELYKEREHEVRTWSGRRRWIFEELWEGVVG